MDIDIDMDMNVNTNIDKQIHVVQVKAHTITMGQGKSQRRVPVVDRRGVPLMPCAPAKARRLMQVGKAVGKWNKLGIFYIQLQWEQEANTQPLCVGIDPGSSFEGYSVVGTQDTVLNIMSEAPTHVKKAVQVRRVMRRARRGRNCRRRPCRFHNRLAGKKRMPPSTRARWEAKARVVGHLKAVLPLTDVAVEDVKAVTRKGKGVESGCGNGTWGRTGRWRERRRQSRWNVAFSPIQVGKEHLYSLLEGMGLSVHKYRGWQTARLREHLGLKKCSAKSKRCFESHALDAWCLAAAVTGAGATHPTCTRLWYMSTIRLNRRQLHMLQYSKGGVRRPQGGTRSLGIKRGTLVQHPKYGLVSIGGYDRKRGTVSVHSYRSGKRLTQGVDAKECARNVLTWTPYRTVLVPLSVDGVGRGIGSGVRLKGNGLEPRASSPRSSLCASGGHCED